MNVDMTAETQMGAIRTEAPSNDRLIGSRVGVATTLSILEIRFR